MSKHSQQKSLNTLTHDIDDITEAQFEQYRHFIHSEVGIHLTQQKQHLVASRLRKRLIMKGFQNYGDYFEHISSINETAEKRVVVDLLTTNETYFFREQAHFDFLRERVLPKFLDQPLMIWSAACSSGEEVYSLAMLLAESDIGNQWRILGSDISQRMLTTARNAIYPMERADKIPNSLLKKYCLKGIGSQHKMFQIQHLLRQQTRFESINLTTFTVRRPFVDLIFLRNVLIYFNEQTKQDVLNRLIAALKPGGYLIVSHAESLLSTTDRLDMILPSIFQLRE